MFPQDFPNLNNPPPGSVLSTNYLNPDYLFDKMVAFFSVIFSIETYNFLKTISVFLSIFFISVIFYSLIRVLEIRRKEHHHLEHEIHEYALHQREKEKRLAAERSVSSNPAWAKVIEHLYSGNPAEFKVAIIDADTMLDRLLTELGFRGENIGEKLRGANQETLRNLSAAWEAHAVRNRIAHEGGSFEISLHEAKRVIALYELVFRAYGYI